MGARSKFTLIFLYGYTKIIFLVSIDGKLDLMNSVKFNSLFINAKNVILLPFKLF